MEKKLEIDPKAFAEAVVSGSQLTDTDDIAASKQALKRYLAAYFLVEQFNELEENYFKNTAQPQIELERLINQLRPFDFNQIR